MSEVLPSSPDHFSRPVLFLSPQIQSRLAAVAAMVLSLAACSASPRPTPVRESGRTPDPVGGVWISLEPDRVLSPPLSDVELQAEGAAFRSVFLQGKVIRQRVVRIAEIQTALGSLEGEAREPLAQELAQTGFDLEVAVFNLFGDIRRTNPRCWARLLRVLRAVSDGTVRAENEAEIRLEQFGEIEVSPDTAVSRKAVLGLYAEQAKFLAFMVARLDRSLAGLRRQFDEADPSERENLNGTIHALEKQQSDLMGLIEGGDIFPLAPTPAEKSAWEQRIFDVFLETRRRAGGQEGLPNGIRFGSSVEPSSNQIQPVEPVRPSEAHPLPPVPSPAPSAPEPEQEQQAPRQDYRPRVV